MPFTRRTNNRILPANSRTADVARTVLDALVPIQQRKYANAFEANGYETLVYNRLKHGVACSCQGDRKAAATILGEDGKLKPGHMEKLLTGGLSFKIGPYGVKEPMREDLRTIRGGKPQPNDERKFDVMDNDKPLADFDLESEDLDNPYATQTTTQNGDEDDAQDIIDQTTDDVSENFDGEEYVSDTKCAVCFGTGYVGGFSLLNGLRLVMSTQWTDITDLQGSIEINRQPHAFFVTSVSFRVVFPKGVMGVDTFRLWNNDIQIHAQSMKIDNLSYSMDLLRAKCDGLPHTVTIAFERLTYFTHVEFQFNMSVQRALFEFPRGSFGSNMQLVENLEDMQLNASPTIPNIEREDMLVECTLGKAMVVSAVTDWKTAKRQILGWDVTVRALQPAELLNLLPRRHPVHQKTTYMVRDNSDGVRRT
jgi:hypothetical protein